jgi:hypothetical protein
MFRIRVCECGNLIPRDPKTGKALYGTGNNPMCERCYRIHKTWKQSRYNPDNLTRDESGRIDRTVNCRRVSAWTAWGNEVP